MRVRFSVPHVQSKWLTDAGIDALAEHIHEMAAVAWDRDCGDIPLEVATDDPFGVTGGCAMRVEKLLDGSWSVLTGPVGRQVARWDAHGLRWLRIH